MRSESLGGAFDHALNAKLQWSVGIAATHQDFFNASPGTLFANAWTAEIRNRFDYVLWQWPERRIRADSWFSLDAGHVFSDSPSRLLKSTAAIDTTWTPQSKGDKYRVQWQISGGAAVGNLPVNQLFELGMERDNPAEFWFRGIAGTFAGRKGSAPLVKQFALMQTDVDRRIFELPLIRLDAGPFFDTTVLGKSALDRIHSGPMAASGLEAQVKTFGNIKFRFVYGRDFQTGRGVFYSAVSR